MWLCKLASSKAYEWATQKQTQRDVVCPGASLLSAGSNSGGPLSALRPRIKRRGVHQKYSKE